MVDIGLPGTTRDTWDRFADLLMHGIIDHHDDPFHFNVDYLSPKKLKLFHLLVHRYFEAGFPDPRMHHLMVGSRKAFLRLVLKYPDAFGLYDQKRAAESMSSYLEEWWLDRSTLPNHFWARLSVFGDDFADILDAYGTSHEFYAGASRREAENWLAQHGYSSLEDLLDAGKVPAGTIPPTAPSDEELIPKLIEYVHSDE